MSKAVNISVAGKAAILATLLSGSSMAIAQEAAAPTVQPVAAPAQLIPVQQAPAPAAQPTVTPPPVVSTLPTENDRVNPAAAEQAAAETSAKREAAVKTKTVATPARSSSRPTTAQTVAAAPIAEPVVANEPTMVTDPLPIENAATVEDTAPIAPVADAADQAGGTTTDEWTLAGGIAAIFAALGLGALATRRRRRASNDNQAEPVKVVPVAAPAYEAPRPIMTPIKDDPVFQQMATRTPVAEPVIQRRPVMTRPDVPVTDPLFTRPISAPPITDPLFAPRNEIEPPITDPLFAKHDRYVGRSRPAEPHVTREPVLEPAE